MKKILVFILAAIVLTTPIMAADNWTDDVVIEASEGFASIDGDFSEWEDIEGYEILLEGDKTVDNYGIYQGRWEKARSNDDFTANFKFMWDEDALYFYEERVDDYVELKGTGEAPYTLGDGNLIFLQVIDGGAKGNETGYSHHIFYIAGDGNGKIGGDAAVRICNRDAGSRNIVRNDAVEIASVETDDGWAVEIMVPWSVFAAEIKGFEPAAGAEIGMSMVPIDFDEDGFAQLCWVKVDEKLGIKGGYDFGGWATLELTEAPVVEEEAGAAPTAAATFDMTIVAAAALALVSGAVISKKRK